MTLISSTATSGCGPPGRRRVGFGPAALLAAVVAGCAAPSATSVFKEAVSDEIPRSVKILNHHQRRSPSIFQPPTYWIHFTASRDDLRGIIQTEQFAKGPSYALKFDHLEPPAWWSPGDLGEDMLVYEREEHPHDSDNSTWKKIMFTNGDMTEAYCHMLVFW